MPPFCMKLAVTVRAVRCRPRRRTRQQPEGAGALHHDDHDGMRAAAAGRRFNKLPSTTVWEYWVRAVPVAWAAP